MLDKSKLQMSRFDEGTMNKKDIELWFFFNEFMTHAWNLVLIEGDISQRSWSLAQSYVSVLDVRDNSNDANNTMHIIHVAAKWEAIPLKDIVVIKCILGLKPMPRDSRKLRNRKAASMSHCGSLGSSFEAAWRVILRYDTKHCPNAIQAGP